MLRKFRNS